MASDFRARYIKYNWVSHDPRIIKRASELAEEFLATYVRKPKKDFVQTFVVILTSIQVLHGYTSDYDLLIPTNNNLYSGSARRHPSYTNQIHKCITWLIESGYLIKQDGIRSQKRHKRAKVIWLPSAYSVNPKLSDKPLAAPTTISRNPLCSYIELRQDFIENKSKVTRRIELSEEQKISNRQVIERTNAVLADYDELMRQVDIRLGTQLVYAAQTSMTRIFSRGDMKLGGRFYSSIQNMKSAARKYLRFDSDPVIEIDYSSIHPTMIYDFEGLTLDGDPYTIEGYSRSDVKVAFNIMLNRNGGKSASSAAKTIAEELHQSFNVAEVLESKIIEKHSKIQHYFNSDSGLALQRQDSGLAFSIIEYFVQTIRRPIITIHDSAVVSVRDTESLILAMKNAYETVIKDKHNFNSSLKGIKADSLDFTTKLDTLLIKSFEGTLEGNDYKKEYWDTCINECTVIEVPDAFNVSSYTRGSVEELPL
jgi:hypothetical protein